MGCLRPFLETPMTTLLMSLFGDEADLQEHTAPENSPRRIQIRRRTYGPAPKQKEWKLKQGRLIAFKKRVLERGQGNEEQWADWLMLKLHWKLMDDFRDRFPKCTNIFDLYDFWSWMLGDPNDPFSFRTCLYADGLRNPDEVIDSAAALAPDWFQRVRTLSPEEAKKELKALANASTDTTAAAAA